MLLSRRTWLKSTSCGFGYLALAGLCAREAGAGASAYQDVLAPKPPHFTPRAKRIIFLCMLGGPSQVDSFDCKPALARNQGKTVSNSNIRASGISGLAATNRILM